MNLIAYNFNWGWIIQVIGVSGCKIEVCVLEYWSNYFSEDTISVGEFCIA